MCIRDRHRSLNLTGDVNQAVVRSNHDDIVVCQTHVACQLAIEDIVVDVDYRNELIISIFLNIKQSTKVVGSDKMCIRDSV